MVILAADEQTTRRRRKSRRYCMLEHYLQSSSASQTAARRQILPGSVARSCSAILTVCAGAWQSTSFGRGRAGRRRRYRPHAGKNLTGGIGPVHGASLTYTASAVVAASIVNVIPFCPTEGFDQTGLTPGHQAEEDKAAITPAHAIQPRRAQLVLLIKVSVAEVDIADVYGSILSRNLPYRRITTMPADGRRSIRIVKPVLWHPTCRCRRSSQSPAPALKLQ